VADADEPILCARCVVDPQGPDNSIMPARTAVAGTLLCLFHTLEAVREQSGA